VQARCGSPPWSASRPPVHRMACARAGTVVVNRQRKMVRAFATMSANKRPRQECRGLCSICYKLVLTENFIRAGLSGESR
jgi:hypothetical protein